MYKPLGTRVLIEADIIEKKIGSIYLPDDTKDKRVLGVILDKGSKVEGVSIGERVIYSSYGAVEIKENDKIYVFVDERDILGVAEDK